jgi:YVTN family beta-propeller protein
MRHRPDIGWQLTKPRDAPIAGRCHPGALSTAAVANIPGATGLAITPDGKHLYITDVTTGSVLVADTATYTISTILPVALAGSGAIAIVSAD